MALKAAREEARLTQVELAELASVSVRPLHVLENEKGSVRLDTYLQLLATLGLELKVVPKEPQDPS